MTDLHFTLRGRGQHAWPWVYAHGQAETLLDTLNTNPDEFVPPDLLSANLAQDQIADGVHDCMVLDQPARLYLWTAKIRRGFVVLLTDMTATEHASDAHKREDSLL